MQVLSGCFSIFYSFKKVC